MNEGKRSGPRTFEGAPAVPANAEAALRRSVMNCLLWEREFYEDGEEIAARILRLAGEVSPEIVEAIGVEARERRHLRHVPLLLVVALAKRREGAAARRLAERVIQRADEMAELCALYATVNGRDLSSPGALKPFPSSLKRALATVFGRFDEYQLAKYNRDGPVRLRDVMFIAHPKPENDEQAALFERVVSQKLATPRTWEVAQSKATDVESKRESWEELLREKRLGALALLRNLRNMEQVGVERGLIVEALDRMDVTRVLPFRFIAAARYAPSLELAIERALMRKVESYWRPRLPGRTILLLDHSGSMSAPVSQRSDLRRHDAAAGLAMLMRERCDSVRVFAFSTQTWEVPARRGFALRDAYSEGYWGSTLLADAIKAMPAHDRLIVVSDEQSHQRVDAPPARGYMVNVASYANGVGFGPWLRVDGFSEAIVDWIDEVEGLSG